MEYPNKIYHVEYKGPNSLKLRSHFSVTVAASCLEVARLHVKELLGIDELPVLLVGAVYPTIWSNNGNEPISIQAKILYSSTFHINVE